MVMELETNIVKALFSLRGRQKEKIIKRVDFVGMSERNLPFHDRLQITLTRVRLAGLTKQFAGLVAEYAADLCNHIDFEQYVDVKEVSRSYCNTLCSSTGLVEAFNSDEAGAGFNPVLFKGGSLNFWFNDVSDDRTVAFVGDRDQLFIGCLSQTMDNVRVKDIEFRDWYIAINTAYSNCIAISYRSLFNHPHIQATF